ncbi:GTPase-activating protein and VPS9 domain-containing protein 1 [Toxocara canis]|uniref:Receptor-mediated endocytosis protein 6 n=1 Tax=Toxocara canis TaxID=6265 RepID=A0A0B2V5K3_TOXCA|nr:GTPase-activating protein and VPS9 domain-containing protein 1 [Toxocara canis]
MDVCNWQGTDSLSILCERLRSEKLLVASELENLQRLNEQVDAEQALLAQLSWIRTHQQEILSRLVNSHPNVEPENSCLLNAQLDAAHFVEAYQRIEAHHYSALTTALNLLLASPRSVAELLHAADQLPKESEGANEDLVSCVFSFLYGCCVFPNDERCVLEVLSHLVEMQLASHSDPRRVLRKGNAAFCRLYRLFSEGLFAAKIFLTAALHDPVMYVLSQDELFLDIDPSKSAIRFPPEERRRRFGEDENSLSYLQKLTAHRKTIESKLIAISTRFVRGITQAMSCFPQSLSWLVRELRSTLVERSKVTAEQVSLICTDLIFTHLICAAIANPETMGVISDTPVTYIARFNLMQVGQILQTLALAPFEQPHPHLAYFYSHFDQDSMARVVQRVLQSSDDSLDAMFGAMSGDAHSHEQLLRRSFVGTFAELNCLHSTLRSTALERLSDANIRRELRTLVRRLPPHFYAIASPQRIVETKTEHRMPSNATRSPEGIHSNSSLSLNSYRNTRLRTLADRVQTAAHRSQQRLLSQHGSQTADDSHYDGDTSSVEVLMFPLGDNREPVGLCSEEKFMESVRQPLSIRKHKISDGAAEKRTRFLDTESIGNADVLEDDGEDISTLPDNFSDVGLISANVSGRGSPSISGPPSVSGRGTPHSAHADGHQQEGSNAAVNEAVATRRANMPNLPLSVRRENSEGLEDKFGKFGLPQQDNRHRYRNADVLEDDGEDISTLPDNFSDVGLISANVSGRGSPSISGPPSVSGRGTPHSAHADGHQQEGSNAAVNEAVATRRANMPNLPLSVRRENSEGLEDKFGKFGLPQQDNRHRYRDDTHSLVSDSWSTDVQPSDTEGFSADARHEGANASGNAQAALQPPGAGAPPLPILPVVAEIGPSRPTTVATNRTYRPIPNSSGGGSSLGVPINAEDRSDTWSVDAMASDSEADPVQRNDDILLIDEPDHRADNASGTSGGDNTPLLKSADSESSLAAGGVSAASQAHHLHPSSSTHHGRQAEDVTSTNASASHPPLQQSKRKAPPGDMSIFGELTAVRSLQGGASSASIGEGSRERIRRQSSGSSFYSKSDVDSEFSKDLNDDALSSLLGDYTPSFRNSVGEIAFGAPASPAASVLATAGSFCNDDVEGQTSVGGQANERSLSPAKNGGASSVPECTNQTNDARDETAMISQRQAEMDTDGEQSGGIQLSEDEIRARWASTGAMPKLVKRNTSQNVDSNAQTNIGSGHAAGVSGSGFARKKINIFQGLQKMGESLKMRKGMAVSSLRQSLSQATTMNELASINVCSNAVPSIGNAASLRGSNQQDTSMGSRRLTGSRSMGELGCSRDRSEHMASEILDKYKGKHAATFDESTYSGNDLITSDHFLNVQKGESVEATAQMPPYYDANNVTQCRAFVDAKRKLRLVLSSVGSGSMPGSSNTAIALGESSAIDSLSAANHAHRSGERSDSEHLIEFLKILLAESINGHDKTLSAQIREVLRCLTAFDEKGVRKLLRTLKDEHRKRTAYLLYLQQSRLTLLQLRSYLEKLSSRVQREKSLTMECLVEVLVRFYLEQRDVYLRRFMADFQLLKAQDERTDAVERTLAMLNARLPLEPMWKHADAEMLAYARKSLERSLMAQIYVLALYPNGEADQCRDSVFHKSLRKLAQVITPDHPDLRIPSRLHGECPWPSAQAEIAIINAYKSPRDKMACVVRCCETIENLIFLAAERGAASADDITPLLVYILIQANPQALLSNIQYVSGFYGNRMEGAEAYWWAQFTSAVEFIKTLLSRHF